MLLDSFHVGRYEKSRFIKQPITNQTAKSSYIICNSDSYNLDPLSQNTTNQRWSQLISLVC